MFVKSPHPNLAYPDFVEYECVLKIETRFAQEEFTQHEWHQISKISMGQL